MKQLAILMIGIFLLVFITPAVAQKTQDQIRSDYLVRISRLIHHWDGKRMFAKWIKLGKMVKFNKRINQIEIDINPNITSEAQYDTRPQVITLKADPSEYYYDTTSANKSYVILWHEAIHAISHGHQNGSIMPSRPFKSAPSMLVTNSKQKVKDIGTAEEAIDHLYINWAEGCIAGLPMLEKLENILMSNGKKIPTGAVKVKSQKLWKMFLDRTNSSDFGQLPDEKEQKELEKMIGFHFDTNEILNGYLSLGYPIEYFGEYITDDQVWKLFPNDDQVGMTGAQVGMDKSKSDKLSSVYIKSWTDGSSGRQCAIHLTLSGSDEISKTVWNTLHSNHNSKFKNILGVGDSAYILNLGPGSSYRALAQFRNASVMMVNMIVKKPKKGAITIKRLPVNWNYIKWIFKNMEALHTTPVPAGVETSIEKLRSDSE